MTALDVAAATHRGAVREHNEDSIAVAGFVCSAAAGEVVRMTVDLGHGPVSCLVADGLGGHPEGGRASRLAATLLSDAWAGGHDPDAVAAAVTAANESIWLESLRAPEWSGMGTTLVGLVFAGDQVMCVNVGDSRCHRLDPAGALIQISVDDSPAPVPGVAAGAITTVVTQTLGGATVLATVEPNLYTAALRTGDRYLLSSDGLTDHVPLDVIEDALREDTDLAGSVRSLLAAALSRGAPDNVSAVLITVVP